MIKAAIVKRRREKGDVGAAVVQGGYLFASAAHQDLDGQTGLLALVRGQHPRQQSGVVVRLEGDAERRFRLSGVPGTPGGRRDRVERDPGVPQENRARRGERDLACGAFQQWDAELAFQFADRAGQRWLRHPEPLRRAPEMQFLGDRDEVAKLPCLGVTHIARVSMVTGSVLQFRGPRGLA
ncbi:hypothetical protein KIPE111705_14645 [Kibdelosporangium persicum]